LGRAQSKALQKVVRFHLNKNTGLVVEVYNPRDSGGRGRKNAALGLASLKIEITKR
jgi:hypothetical protein